MSPVVWLDAPVHVGILRLSLSLPGARSLKDRRRVVVSLRDRIRARFDVSCHDVSGHDLHQSATLLVTTGGAEPALLRAVLDRVGALADATGDCLVLDATSEVRAWPDPEPWREE